MSRVDKNLYEFITHPDRFRAAAEIADQMKHIENELWDDFMNQVRIYLLSIIPEGWNVEPSGEEEMFEKDRSDISIFNDYYVLEKGGNAVFWICFLEEYNDFGLWFDSTYSRLDSKEMQQDIEDLKNKEWKKGYSWGKEQGEFIVYKKADETFIDAVDFEIILPENREELVKKYARYLNDSIKDLDAKAKKWFDASKMTNHRSNNTKKTKK